jgi:hypothetical protein
MSPVTFVTPNTSNTSTLQVSLHKQFQDSSASVSPLPVNNTTEMIAVPTPPLAPPAFLDEMIHPSVNSKLKRCLDIVGALVGLFVTALLFIPVAIAIWREDPGSIFYSQERCGVGGKRFRIWKFRSMVMDADAIKHLLKNEASGHIFKIEDDPRVTRIGKLLRRTSLDEFPQFWNVLMGDMSLVGTRMTCTTGSVWLLSPALRVSGKSMGVLPSRILKILSNWIWRTRQNGRLLTMSRFWLKRF